MYIDYNREIVRIRVAGHIPADGCTRLQLAGIDVRISTYTDRRGCRWTVATYNLDPSLEEWELSRQGDRMYRALRAYCLNWIRRF